MRGGSKKIRCEIFFYLGFGGRKEITPDTSCFIHTLEEAFVVPTRRRTAGLLFMYANDNATIRSRHDNAIIS
jgi:hypothetical protein